MPINNRQILVISGSLVACQKYALAITQHLNCLNLDQPKKANDYLGQEFDAVIFNTFDVFDPNALGAIAGTIRAGGYLLFIKPLQWAEESLFLKRFQSLLNSNKQLRFIDAKNAPSQVLTIANKKPIDTLYASSDQQRAVEAIKKVVTGHRRRPLVITADRGRGKSASLGIASAFLLAGEALAGTQLLAKSNKVLNNIIVCAPSKKTAEVIFKQAEALYPEAEIQFYSPDNLKQQQPKTDLLLIDEAGAIPLPLLENFLQHYSRIVFATTLHGYEGSGSGFSLKFFKVLDAITPDWKHCELKTPIRYAENDPLEKFMFEALLLNAEAVNADVVTAIKPVDCKVQIIEKSELINDEVLLREVFGLLVNAHYQTKPSDLMRLLDDDLLTIKALVSQQHIIAVALLMSEGGLDSKLATQVFQGKRRVKGHLVAQALSANAGIEMAPCLIGERISRIAVHPQYQNQSFGSYLLKMLYETSHSDYISTSFGASQLLICFWKKSNFTAVYLGMKRDASSGAHSVIMLKGISEKGKELVKDTHQRFLKNFFHLIAGPLINLEEDIALELISDFKNENKSSLSEAEKQELLAFANHQRGLENTLYSIWKFTCEALPKGQNKLRDDEKNLLLYKVIQNHSWKSIQEKAGISGKKEGLLLLRQAINNLYSLK